MSAEFQHEGLLDQAVSLRLMRGIMFPETEREEEGGLDWGDKWWPKAGMTRLDHWSYTAGLEISTCPLANASVKPIGRVEIAGYSPSLAGRIFIFRKIKL